MIAAYYLVSMILQSRESNPVMRRVRKDARLRDLHKPPRRRQQRRNPSKFAFDELHPMLFLKAMEIRGCVVARQHFVQKNGIQMLPGNAKTWKSVVASKHIGRPNFSKK